MNISKAIQLLKDNGYKYTGKRLDMLEFLKRNDRYVTAKEVLDALRDDYPGISFDTVYRNLALFGKLGILEETEWDGERHFRFQCSESESHHHHFICLKCGKTREIRICPMEDAEKQLEGCFISGHKFEIYGYCRQCRSERPQAVHREIYSPHAGEER
jgi:zinc uptake regulator, Fur family